MTATEIGRNHQRRALRLWPGVAIVVLQWLGRFGVKAVFPEAMPLGVLAGLVGGLLILVWWVFFSRAPWSERLGAVALMALALFVTARLLHVSVATGMMQMMFPVYAVPTLSLAFVAWAAFSRRLAPRARWAAMAAAILAGTAPWALVRTGGFTADLDHDLAWRWSKTREERLLEKTAGESASAGSAALPAGAGPEWPGFRGPGRDAHAPGVRIATDWATSPPVELWRRPVGPGWSSFAVHGGLVYTQEQRGEDEVVSCYDAATGQVVWRHGDAARFWESNAGAGPRGTPTLSDGRVYTFGATGILNALDATDGSAIWSRDVAADTGAKLPDWGFASSPLVVEDVVVVAASGHLAGYDRETGKRRWLGPAGRTGYSSPHLATIDGVVQVLFSSGDGLVSVDPTDGAVLWDHEWRGYPIVQPALTGDGGVLLNANERSGLRRLAAARGPDGWELEERWTSLGLKPYFSDFVVHEGHAYGFDGSILAAIDLTDGERKWKGGRYGQGQLVLLAEQDLLLVVSERGGVALVSATPDGFTELARSPAIEGRTWNHPVLVGDLLLVRNAHEMAAFRLATASG